MFDKMYVGMASDERITELIRINNFRIDDDFNLEFAWNKQFLLVRIDSKYFLLPRSCILLYHNKVCDIISCLTLSTFASISSMPSGAVEIVISFIKELASLLIKLKTKYFHIVKAQEGLVIAETLKDEEEWVNTEFLTAVSRSVFENSGFDYMASTLRTLIQSAGHTYET